MAVVAVVAVVAVAAVRRASRAGGRSPVAERAESLLGIVTPAGDGDPVTGAGFSVFEAGMLREWLGRLAQA